MRRERQGNEGARNADGDQHQEEPLVSGQQLMAPDGAGFIGKAISSKPIADSERMRVWFAAMPALRFEDECRALQQSWPVVADKPAKLCRPECPALIWSSLIAAPCA